MGEKKRRLAAAAALTERLAEAQRLHATGRLQDAEKLYRQVLEADAKRGDAWLGAGVLARDGGAPGAAVRLFAQAVALAPDNADQLAKQGMV